MKYIEKYVSDERPLASSVLEKRADKTRRTIQCKL